MSIEAEDTADSTLSNGEPAPSRPTLDEQPFLFLVLRADQPLGDSSRHALGDVDEVQLRRGSARASFRVTDGGSRRLVLVIPDRWMSGEHARIRRDGSSWVLEDLGAKNGTFIAGRRVTTARLEGDDVIEVGHTFLYLRRSLPTAEEAGLDCTSAELHAPAPLLATLSPTLGRIFRVLSDVARSSIPIHVTGETGTGKEVVARSVHALSGRTGAFVAVNCGALPQALVEAELFGFRKGAFSGAHEDRAGLVRTAHEGTLLLDEIGDLPHAAQSALLRVLQEREVMPLGAVKPVPVNVRIVSATHRDLEAAVAAGTFRADLFARLAGFRLKLPALRDRREDLGLLVARILQRIDDFSADGVALSAEAARALMTHAWAGNVRELEHRLRLGVVLAKGGVVELGHVFGPEAESSIVDVQASPARPPSGAPAAARSLTPMDLTRRAALEALLREHGGNVSAVARAMGKARMQIQRWMKRYGLEAFSRE